MSWWSDRVVPHITDVALRSSEIGELRDEACRGLHGRVLEIGFGSGLNLRFYPSAVTSVAAVEPSDVGWKLSEDRRGRTDVLSTGAGWTDSTSPRRTAPSTPRW